MRSEVDRSIVEQRILEASCRIPGPGGVSGWATLRLYGVGYLDGLDTDGRTELPVPLAIPLGTALRSTSTIEVHRDRLEPSELVRRHGISSTSAERAAFDAARWTKDTRLAVGILDLALASGAITRASFDGYLDARAGRPGTRKVARTLRLCDPRSMSPKETALRLIWVLDAGLPVPRSNWPVADAHGRFIGRPDLLSVELAVVGEFDGGLHRSRARQRDDLRRDDAFRAVGLEPFRVVGADLDDVPLVLARISAAIERAANSGVQRTWMVQSHPRPVA